MGPERCPVPVWLFGTGIQRQILDTKNEKPDGEVWCPPSFRVNCEIS